MFMVFLAKSNPPGWILFLIIDGRKINSLKDPNINQYN